VGRRAYPWTVERGCCAGGRGEGGAAARTTERWVAMMGTGNQRCLGVSFIKDASSALGTLGGARYGDLVRSHFPSAKSVGD
jgi:hypothetical protein